jgi:site-specific recombinase XerD
VVASLDRKRLGDIGVLREGEKTRFGFHILRHNLASFLVSQGENPTVVQKTLRHSKVTTTLGLYSHVAGDDRLNAQEAFFCASTVVR